MPRTGVKEALQRIGAERQQPAQLQTVDRAPGVMAPAVIKET
jgi:hypothetical protein